MKIEFSDSGLPGWLIITILVFILILLLLSIIGLVGSIITYGLW